MYYIGVHSVVVFLLVVSSFVQIGVRLMLVTNHIGVWQFKAFEKIKLQVGTKVCRKFHNFD